MISAVIHTYNEENNINRCLASLDFADEIIVIDMGSTDKTVGIARDFKAKIYSHPYTGFVEPARNFGISKAAGGWILIVDADEEIPVSLSRHLKRIVKVCTENYFRIPRKNIIFGKWMKHAGWWPDYKIRFFQKNAVSWNEKIHGIPITKGIGKDIEPHEELSIIHHNYQTVDQFILRLNRYSSISAKELYLSNERFHFAKLFEATSREFISRYFFWEGYKDGIHGLALSFLQALSELVTYVKLWELEGFWEKKITLAEIDELFKKTHSKQRYWLTEKILQQPHNIFQDIILKLKRKIDL